MRNRDFEFDGDKTDLVRKGWSDVDQLHSPQIKTYVFRNRVAAMGPAMVTRDEVIVETEDGIKTFPRSELISILKGGQRERDWWVFELGVGFTGAFGNSNQSSLHTDFGLGRHDKRTSTVLLYEGTFGAANREANVNRHLGQVGVTLFLSDRFYVLPAAAAFFHDRFANIVFTTIGNTNHIGEATFTVEINDIFNFKTEFEYFRTEQPLPRQDGSIPKCNDFQLIVGFSIRVG